MNECLVIDLDKELDGLNIGQSIVKMEYLYYQLFNSSNPLLKDGKYVDVFIDHYDLSMFHILHEEHHIFISHNEAEKFLQSISFENNDKLIQTKGIFRFNIKDKIYTLLSDNNPDDYILDDKLDIKLEEYNLELDKYTLLEKYYLSKPSLYFHF